MQKKKIFKKIRKKKHFAYCRTYRPSDEEPFTTDKPKVIIRVNVPEDARTTDLNLPTNRNVDYFTVDVRKPNGNLIPVKDGQVHMFNDLIKRHKIPLCSGHSRECRRCI